MYVCVRACLTLSFLIILRPPIHLLIHPSICHLVHIHYLTALFSVRASGGYRSSSSTCTACPRPCSLTSPLLCGAEAAYFLSKEAGVAPRVATTIDQLPLLARVIGLAAAGAQLDITCKKRRHSLMSSYVNRHSYIVYRFGTPFSSSLTYRVASSLV